MAAKLPPLSDVSRAAKRHGRRRPAATGAMVQRKPNVTRVAAVYATLKRAILEQAIQPGTRLPEDAIGERLGVSRTIVHEALVRLSSEGLIDLHRNRGAFVASPSLDEGRDIFFVRNTLERLVAESLTGRLTGEQRQQLTDHVHAEEQALDRDEPQSIRLAGEFHTLLASMTGNAMLVRFMNEAVSRSSLILALFGRPHSAECAVSEHRALIAALIGGDARKTGELMARHMDSVMTRALVANRPKRTIQDVLAIYSKDFGL